MRPLLPIVAHGFPSSSTCDFWISTKLFSIVDNNANIIQYYQVMDKKDANTTKLNMNMIIIQERKA